MNNEYMTNMFIDAVQNAKREWIKTFVKTEDLAKPMNDFVTAQATYTKEFAKTMATFNNAVGDVIAKSVKA
jgi:hypothetical protein